MVDGMLSMTYSVNGLPGVPQSLLELYFHRLQLIQFNVFHASLFVQLNPFTLQHACAHRITSRLFSMVTGAGFLRE